MSRQLVELMMQPVIMDPVLNELDSITQTNDATATHVDDIFQDNTGSFSQVLTLNNGCDATTFTDNGDNSAICSNDSADNIIGPVGQTNTATGLDDVLIDQDNIVAVSQDLSANNNCDSTALNDAECTNDSVDNEIGTITQDNTATGDDFADISQGNDATIAQTMDLLNSCSESGAGINDAVCDNNLAVSFIGPVDQTNTVSDAAQIDTFTQSNVAQVTQTLQGTNDCDEANTGDNLATCGDIQEPENFFEGITQTNDATAGDDTVQSNFVGVVQDMQLDNDCDETGVGDNEAFCSSELADNGLGLVGQSNSAEGSGDADFTQNNNIPTINQVIDAGNDCDQTDEETASGGNFADCTNFDPFNFLNPITQTNDATATHVDDIFQDNTGSFSQVITLNNGCDATTFTDNGDNSADCNNDSVQNSIGPVGQTNTATGLDDVLIDQENNVAVSQDLSARNNCDATGLNDAICSNFDAANDIQSITQDNTATGDDFADISQSNDATITQTMDLLNSCSESGAGISEAECDNDSAENLIGPVSQTNTATGDADDDFTQSNVIDVTQNLEGRNDCDEANTGDNLATCSTDISNNIASITQTNTIDPLTGTQSHDQSNLFTVTQNLVATNNCDESGLGDNNANCSIISSNDIGIISQSNTDSSNVLTISQDGQWTNDCDDTTDGDNDADCTIDISLVVPDTEQTGDETQNIEQHQSLVNTCPAGGGVCSIHIMTILDDPNKFSFLSQADQNENRGEEGGEDGGAEQSLAAFSTLQTEAEAEAESGKISSLGVNDDNDNNNNNENTDTNDGGGDANGNTAALSTETQQSSHRRANWRQYWRWR